jgi:Glycosyltransferase family 87
LGRLRGHTRTAMATRPEASTGALEPALAGGLAPREPLADRAAAWRTEATARRALATAVAAGLGVAVLAAAQPSPLVPPSKEAFSMWMVGPFRGLGAWLPQSGTFQGAAFTALVLLMFCGYGVTLACERHVPVRWGVGALAALHMIFLLGPPLTLTDVFNYLNYARLGPVHGVNPYAAAPAEVPVDPAYGFATWHDLRSPYGPLFLLVSYPLTALPVPVAFWALKTVIAAASAGCLALVWSIARRMGRPPLPAILFVGLNPLVLVYGLGGVHNDFLMVGLILAGIAALLAARPAASGAALTAAAGIKLSGGLMLPFAFLGSRRRGELAAGAVAAGAALAALSLAAFGFHLPGLEVQSSLVTPLSPPNLLGLALGQGGATAAVRLLVQLALVATLAWLLVRTARGEDWLTMGGWATLALVVSLSWEMPWYVLWVLPLAVLSGSRALRRAALALSMFLLLTLAPMTGYLLTEVCGCSPSQTETGKRNAAEIGEFLR